MSHIIFPPLLPSRSRRCVRDVASLFSLCSLAHPTCPSHVPEPRARTTCAITLQVYILTVTDTEQGKTIRCGSRGPIDKVTFEIVDVTANVERPITTIVAKAWSDGRFYFKSLLFQITGRYLLRFTANVKAKSSDAEEKPCVEFPVVRLRAITLHKPLIRASCPSLFFAST